MKDDTIMVKKSHIVCAHTHVHVVCVCMLRPLLQDPLTEGLHRIKVILQTTRQLFGEVDRKDNNVLPLLYDGKRFLLQNQPVVSPVNTTPVSVSDTKKTEKVRFKCW